MRVGNNVVASMLVVVALIGSAAGGFYGSSSNVINLTPDNFAQNVFATEHVWIVEFYAPWCGHCKNLAPEWEKLATNLKGIVKVAAVDADAHRELGAAFGVSGFPTIKIFPSKIEQTSEGLTKAPIDYNGPRDAASIASTVLGHLPNFVTSITKKQNNFDAFFQKGETWTIPKVLLFSEKKKVTDLYKALAIDFKNSLSLAQIESSYTQAVQQFNIDKFPALLVLESEDSTPKLYTEKEFSHSKLFNFLRPYAVNYVDPTEFVKKGKTHKKQQETKQEEPIRDPTAQIHTTEDWEKTCFGKKMCGLALLDPINSSDEEMARYQKTLTEASAKWNKSFNFGWIDAVTQTQLVRELNLADQFPQFILLGPTKWTAHFGSFETEPVSEFFERVTSGAQRLKRLTTKPTFEPKSD